MNSFNFYKYAKINAIYEKNTPKMHIPMVVFLSAAIIFPTTDSSHASVISAVSSLNTYPGWQLAVAMLAVGTRLYSCLFHLPFIAVRKLGFFTYQPGAET